jgi:hypothetical protein
VEQEATHHSHPLQHREVAAAQAFKAVELEIMEAPAAVAAALAHPGRGIMQAQMVIGMRLAAELGKAAEVAVVLVL